VESVGTGVADKGTRSSGGLGQSKFDGKRIVEKGKIRLWRPLGRRGNYAVVLQLLYKATNPTVAIRGVDSQPSVISPTRFKRGCLVTIEGP